MQANVQNHRPCAAFRARSGALQGWASGSFQFPFLKKRSPLLRNQVHGVGDYLNTRIGCIEADRVALSKVTKLNQVVDKKWHCYDALSSVRALHGIDARKCQRLDDETTLNVFQIFSGDTLALVKAVMAVVTQHELVVVVLVLRLRLLQVVNRKRASVFQAAERARIIGFNKEQVVTCHG
jgi:hypothetical protein